MKIRDRLLLAKSLPMILVFKMKTRKTIVRFFIVLLCTLFVLEAMLRLFFVKPSKNCYGRFNQLELPPCDMRYFDKAAKIVDNKVKIDHDMLFGIFVNGIELTVADVGGGFSEDSKCGYAYEKNFTSFNNWWQSNNVGARYRKDVTVGVPEGYKRFLAFGESYTNCPGVPQEETWPYFLEQGLDRTEILNFGVNGYSMTQSYLRFQQVASEIDYDTVLFTFIPMDISREINIARCLCRWRGCRPTPRHILKDNKLVLVEALYPDIKSYYLENESSYSDRFLKFLAEYDRYYSRQRYEGNKFFGKSVLYKIIYAIYYERKIASIDANLMSPDSEAFQITKAIFTKVNETARKNGKDFILAFLPEEKDVKAYKRDKHYVKKWNKMFSAMCDPDFKCIDLMSAFKGLPESSFDKAYDGTHYGPKINKIIAKIIGDGALFLHN